MAEQHGKTLVPEIRFSGFTDPWEQRKLGEFDIKTGPFGSTLHAEDYVACGTPIVTTEHFKEGELPSMGNGIPQVGDRDAARLSQYKLQKHDIVFSRVGSVDLNAEVKDAQVGWLFSGRVLRLRTDRGINSTYLHYELGTVCVRSSIIERAVGLTMASINTRILGDTAFFVPATITEQRQIGAFFDRLDSLITLHQRKYDKLCVLKKSMLDKMFPKGGSLYPEIRFFGFTDPWEQRKLGELYQKNDERNTDGLGSERTLSVASMTFNSTGNGADESSLPNYKRLRLGDIAFEGHANKEFSYGRFVLNDAGNGIMSPRFTCLRPIAEQEYSFWKYFIHSEEVMRPILVNSTKSGTMMNELVVKDFLEQEILVPSLPEQRRIGAFFDRLDSLITLHQRKLELLRNIKKSMLDKMFV